MNDLVNIVLKLEMNEIENYTFPLDEPFGLEINYYNTKFCFIIKFSSKNKNIICCESGAQKRSGKNSSNKTKYPPYLDRWSWNEYFEESFLTYADPIFFEDETITLGWYVGNDKHWYLKSISEILEKLCFNQNIQKNNILFYGTSGGGFSSIVLGTLIKNSKVLVNNAQFNILKYNKNHITNLFRVLKKNEGFSNLSESEIIHQIDYRLNVINLFKKMKYIPQITYYINCLSSADFNNQFLPFLNDLKKLSFFKDQFEVHFYKEVNNNPHFPLCTEKSKILIKSFAKDNLYND